MNRFRYVFRRDPKVAPDYSPIISDIRRIFLNFDDDTLESIFKDYRNKYGNGAYEYAKQTYQLWKHKKVHISEKTMLRFCKILPLLEFYSIMCLEVEL